MWTGANDTKYVTPQKAQLKLNSLITTQSQSASGLYTIVTFSDYANAKVITIRGTVDSNSNGHDYIINGSSIVGRTSSNAGSSVSALTIAGATSNTTLPFEFEFDLNAKTFKGYYIPSGSTYLQIMFGKFSSITNFQIRIRTSQSFSLDVQLSS